VSALDTSEASGAAVPPALSSTFRPLVISMIDLFGQACKQVVAQFPVSFEMTVNVNMGKM
jgi:hypothetical protein